MRKSSSIQKVDELCRVLYQFSKYTHLNSSYFHYTACLSCSKDLRNIAVRAGEEVNSVSKLCLYIAEAALLGSREPLKNLAAKIAAVLAQAVKTRRRFFERYNQHKSNESRMYEEEHCYGTGIMNDPLHGWLAEENSTGEIFPRRPEVKCRIVCDRFHYRTHTYSSIWDPDSYQTCRSHSSSGAESINYLWNFSKSHLRFLKPENLIPFLAARSVFMNVRANLRQEDKNADISVDRSRNYLQNK